jgi:transposase
MSGGIQPALIPDPPVPVVIQNDPPGKKKEAKSAVETHPRREEIIRDIVGGEMSNRAVAEKYGISHGAVNRYKNGRLLPKAAEAARARDGAEGAAVLARVEKVMERVQKLYDACDEYLKDPEDPGKYTLFPRAWELEVVYRETVPVGDKTRTVVRKALLQALLERVSGKLDIDPVTVNYRGTDPRKLLIEAARGMKEQLELLAKIQGAVKDTVNTQINVVILPGKETGEVEDGTGR